MMNTLFILSIYGKKCWIYCKLETTLVVRLFYHVNTILNSLLASQLILFSAKMVDAINFAGKFLNVDIFVKNYVIFMNKQDKIKLDMMTINVCKTA